MQEEYQDSANFLSRLELAMRLRGLRDVDLFREYGIAQSTVSRWRAGSMPRIATCNALADALKVNRHWLADGKGRMEEGRLTSVEVEYKLSRAPYSVLLDGLLEKAPAEHLVELAERQVAIIFDSARKGIRPTAEIVEVTRTLWEAIADKSLPS